MKSIKFYITVLLITMCSMANAQNPEPYLNVYQNGTYKSFRVTADLKISWGKKMDFVPEYVNLGLPSGTLWATCNVGAYNPEEYGDYFAWGETEPKNSYTLENYKYYNNGWIKYNSIDNKTELEPEDDAATANWGSEWQMPNLDQWREVQNNCTFTQHSINGNEGLLVTSKVNGNTIFLPSFGKVSASDKGRYWSSTIDAEGEAHCFYFDNDYDNDYDNQAYYHGLPVRPVKKTTGTAKRTNNINVKWVQLWKNGPKFAEYNVGAANNKAEDYGGYYSWGGSQNKVTSDYNTGTAVLSGDNDTATKLWGSNWRMPTQAELQALINNCEVEWTTNYNGTDIKGAIFTGKNDYSSNSVFFPAAGTYSSVYSLRYQGSVGYYWSSTPEDDEDACCFFIDSDENPDMTDGTRGSGLSVRAVLAEE